jgi:hypothetical protein
MRDVVFFIALDSTYHEVCGTKRHGSPRLETSRHPLEQIVDGEGPSPFHGSTASYNVIVRNPENCGVERGKKGGSSGM